MSPTHKKNRNRTVAFLVAASASIFSAGFSGCGNPTLVVDVTRVDETQGLSFKVCNTTGDFTTECFSRPAADVFSTTTRSPTQAVIGVDDTDGTTPLRLVFQETNAVIGCYMLDVDTTAGQVTVDVSAFGCPLVVSCAPAASCKSLAPCPGSTCETQ